MEREYISKNLGDTARIAKDISDMVAENSLVLIGGTMGTGKTTLCSKIVTNFGIEDLASSSFQRVTLHRGKLNIVHCDFYRGTYNYDFYTLEIEPQLIPPWIVLMEWSSSLADIEDLYNGPTYRINIKMVDPQTRLIKINRIS